jgi:YesN/AraC family two-component response regulator
MSHTILFVDDEKQILKAIKREFFDSEYEIVTADSGQAALDIMEQTKIDLIITDMRMPEMDGYELLRRVKETYPSTRRIILSGYADENIIKDALNNGLTEFYLFKPWGSREIITAIEMALGE